MKVKTGISVEVKKWDPKKQRIKPAWKEAEQINQALEKFRDKILYIILKIGRLPAKTDLAPDGAGIFDAIDAQRKRILSLGRTASSAQGYKTLAANLARFHKDRHRTETSIHEIDEDYITAFLGYMIEKGSADSHSGKMVGMLKTVLRRNKVKTNWQETQNIKVRYPDNIYLSETELETLRNLDLSGNPRLDRNRDIFLAACYTGQRYSDLRQIAHDRGLIAITQQKTGERVLVPLKPELEKILSKYPDGLPVPTNQEMNRTIKWICREAGMTAVERINVFRGGKKELLTVERCELVSCHTARRTFATHAILAGIPTEIVMRFTGHRNYKEFQKYIRASQQDAAKRFRDHPFFQ